MLIEHRLGNAVSTAAWRASTNRARCQTWQEVNPRASPESSPISALCAAFNGAHNGPLGDGLSRLKGAVVVKLFQDVESSSTCGEQL